VEEKRDSNCAVWEGGASIKSQTADKEKLRSTLANTESYGLRNVLVGEAGCDREVADVAENVVFG